MNAVASIRLAASLLVGAGFTAVAQEVTEKVENNLKMGDPAPKMQVSKWVQGEAVKEFEKDKVYIVEFWATWCGPCRATIPHVNEIQKKFADKGVIVIGQNCWEQAEDKVADFVKEMGEKMTYRVALDDKSKDERGFMAKNWMQAAGQSGIPCAFVVDKNQKVAWIGHPQQLDEKLLEEVIAGTFDVSKALKAKEEEDSKREEMMKRGQALTEAMQNKDWAAAETALAELEKVMPERNKKFLGLPKFKILLGQKKTDDAYALAEKLSEGTPNSPQLHNELAWGIATAEGLDKPNLDLAEKLARRAVEIAPDAGKSMTQDTLARILFLKGKKDEAIKLEEEALSKAPDQLKDTMKKSLESYKEGKLPPSQDE